MKARNPRHGSMQFWPRVRAKKETPKIAHWAASKDAKPLGFAGYKVGMTHVQYKDEDKNSSTKGEIVSTPVTIIECPPLRMMGIRAYKKVDAANKIVADIHAEKQTKEISKRVTIKPSKKLDAIAPESFDKLVAIMHTYPHQTGIGKKTPEVMEIALGGSKEDQLNYAKEHLGKDIQVADIFGDGEYVDVHAVTTGKGYQGPVKRFGVSVRESKSEKTKRAPGSLGGWKGQAHVMYRIAYAGQMGYHTRVTYNQPLLKVGDKPDDVNIKGGFLRYGNVKSNYVLIKGSVHGPKKRLIRFNKAQRATRKLTPQNITFISQASQQGNRI